MKKITSLFLLLSIFIFLNGCSSSDDDAMAIPTPMAVMSLEAEGNSLSFEAIVENNTTTKKLTITNTGNATLEIFSTTVPNGFATEWSSGKLEPYTSLEIEITFAPTAITEYSGDITFKTNTAQSSTSIACSGNGISSVYDGDVALISDQEIEEFAAKGYTQINGELCLGLCDERAIFSNAITSLLPLSKIIAVNDFRIKINDGLTNLKGLEQMVVSGNIRIWNVSNIVNIDEMAINTNLTGTIELLGNDSLQNINGLSNVVQLGNINILNNSSITNLDGLVSLTSLSGFFWVHDNPMLIDFCSVVPLFQNGYSPEPNEYTVFANAFDPTQEDLASGICGQ